ncbi:hypothetical protein ACOMHN_006652 [Nucella lapillus]
MHSGCVQSGDQAELFLINPFLALNATSRPTLPTRATKNILYCYIYSCNGRQTYQAETCERTGRRHRQPAPVIQKEEVGYRQPAPVIHKEEVGYQPAPVIHKEEVGYRQPAPVIHKEEVGYQPAPVIHKEEVGYRQPAPVIHKKEVGYQPAPVIHKEEVGYRQPAPVIHKEEVGYQPAPVTQKEEVGYLQPAPVIQREEVGYQPAPVTQKEEVGYRQPAPVIHKEEVGYYQPAPVIQKEEVGYRQPAPVIHKEEVGYQPAPVTQKEEIKKEEEQTKRELGNVSSPFGLGGFGSSGSQSFGSGNRNKPKLPKLPNFRDKTDDIDSYLFRFEANARAQGFSQEFWPLVLSSHLEGAALSLYHSLADGGEELTYGVLRDNLCKKFRCTEDGYRKRFRESKPGVNESFDIYAVELKRLMDRWIALSEIDKSFDGLVDLFLSEQLMQSVSKDLKTFLCEKNLKSFPEKITAAESYRVAHPEKVLSRKSDGSSVYASVGMQESVEEEEIVSAAFSGYYQSDRSCPRFRNFGALDREQRGGRNVRRGRGFNPNQFREPYNSADFTSYRDAGSYQNRDFRDRRAVDRGKVNGTVCFVLRDTGATVCCVRKRLVCPDQYTGETIKCVSFGGRVDEFPLARVDVSSEYITGEIVCCVLEAPVADFIVGNISKDCEGVTVSAGLSVETAAAITRSRSRHVVEKRPLADLPQVLEVTPDELAKRQKDDKSLTKCFDMAKSGEVRSAGKTSHYYQVVEGILYRIFKKGTQSWEQVVVPTNLRSSVLTVSHDTILSGHCGARRTLCRLREKFDWPGVTVDVAKYVTSCDVCQRVIPKGKVPPVPLAPVPLVGVPFHRVAIDLVGPIKPASEQGHRYILTH